MCSQYIKFNLLCSFLACCFQASGPYAGIDPYNFKIEHCNNISDRASKNRACGYKLQSAKFEKVCKFYVLFLQAQSCRLSISILVVIL